MPNIDTSSIEGFQEMTAEQQVKALLALDVPEKVDLTGYIQKKKFDETASELAAAKKQLKERMTTEEAQKADADKAMQDLQSKYNELVKSSTIANHTARYLALPGYDEKLARETAEALFEGDMEKVFQNQQKANEAHEKEIKAGMMKQEGTLPGGGAGDPPEDPAVALAKKMGKERAQAAQKSGLDKFFV